PAPENGGDAGLRRALTLKSRIARLMDVEPGGGVGEGRTWQGGGAWGDSAGYGRRWTAERPSRIALVMCGYADGLRRALSNRAQVLVRGCRAPIAGRIAMD